MEPPPSPTHLDACVAKVDTVEAAYSVLKATLAGVEDFVSLQRAHQEFLDTLRTKFHLDDLVVSQVRRRRCFYFRT